MRVLRCWEPAIRLGAMASLSGDRDHHDVQRRQEAAEVAGVPRCPRCGGELVARMSRGSPGFWCRCPVRRVIAKGA